VPGAIDIDVGAEQWVQNEGKMWWNHLPHRSTTKLATLSSEVRDPRQAAG